MGQEPEEIAREIEDTLVQEEEHIEKIAFLENRVFAEENKTVRLEKTICTDMKVNRRVVIPAGREPKEEAELEVRKWMMTGKRKKAIGKDKEREL